MSIEQGQAFFGNCERRLFISFMKPKADTNYGVCVCLRNDRDSHPMDLGSLRTLIRKQATGFWVELDQHVDSPFYAIDYTVIDGHTRDSVTDRDGRYLGSDRWAVINEAPPPFKKECTCEGHTLFHKGCQCGAVSKKKWGLGT